MEMDPTLQDQNSDDKTKPPKNSLDLSSILLPKKDAPSVDSAQRVDASVLLKQEQNATLTPPQKSPLEKVLGSPEAPLGEGASGQTFSPGISASASAGGVSSAAGGGNSSGTDLVRPLQTYQNDVASVVQQGASVVSIAAAEADRRGSQPLDSAQGATSEPRSWRTYLFIGIGTVLLLAAGGLMWYALSRTTPLPAQNLGETPYITTDGVNVITLPQGASAAAIVQQLAQAKKDVSLSLGLVAQLYVQKAPTTTGAAPTYETAQDLLGNLAPSLSGTFLRNIAPIYVLGVHTFGVNQPLLLLKVDSYEQAYAGMLAWENTMHRDLSPLFDYTPAPKIKPVPTGPVSLPAQTGTTTIATSTSSTTPPAPIDTFVPTGFIDKVVVNHDARVLQNADGTIYFLWTFLDRNTLLITTNEDTVRAVITRLTQAPVLTLPSSQ